MSEGAAVLRGADAPVSRRPLATATVVAVISVFGLGACGSDFSPSKDSAGGSESSSESGAVADEGVCTSEATAIESPYGEGFPADWPFPPKTVVYDVEDRDASGVIVTAVSSRPFADVLDFMNTEVVDAGFEVESGETEEHDAEAEWRGSEFHGRWAIRESGQCPGETVIQVLAGEN